MRELPALPYAEWRETCETLHRWMQVVGKIKLALTPKINHWWNVTFLVSAHGLTTSGIASEQGMFDIELDFLEDMMRIRTEDGSTQYVELRPRTVADFYAATMQALRDAGITAHVWTMPVEIADPLRFEADVEHRTYVREHAVRFWHVLAWIDRVLQEFRARFVGKSSPVHFFWGSFDLAVTRFSGRRAAKVPDGVIESEAYSHEVSSVGWWPGDARLERPSFYSYAAPQPPGFADATIRVPGAYYHPQLQGFYLDHDAVRTAADPEATLLAFCEETYAAAAELGHWPRAELERLPPVTGEGRHANV
jgi:hypothetical protein